jgi:hypothetical protein
MLMLRLSESDEVSATPKITGCAPWLLAVLASRVSLLAVGVAALADLARVLGCVGAAKVPPAYIRPAMAVSHLDRNRHSQTDTGLAGILCSPPARRAAKGRGAGQFCSMAQGP